MRVYLDKLRELVPGMPRTGKLSRVRLIHSAIDYITDLQEALEARTRRKLRDKQGQAPRPPLAALPPSQLEANTQRASPLSETSSNRLPPHTGERHPPSTMELDSTATFALGPASINTLVSRNTGPSDTNNRRNSSGDNDNSTSGNNNSVSGNSCNSGRGTSASSSVRAPLPPSEQAQDPS